MCVRGVNLTFFGNSTDFHQVIHVDFVITEYIEFVDGHMEFAGLIVLRPIQNEHIQFDVVVTFLHAKAAEIDVNRKRSQPSQVARIATNSNERRAR